MNGLREKYIKKIDQAIKRMKACEMLELGFRFEFPEVLHGYWDVYSKDVYVFGKRHTPETSAKAIDHEALHYTIQRVAGPQASERFDLMRDKVHRVDRGVYDILY